MTRNSDIEILNEERSFQIEELFFSTTDQCGVIRHGNEVFLRIAGYEASELFGAPHSIIRHPDMPRVVFKLLWDTIESGKTIAAYVKNLAKDGRYYWVLAVVMPCDGGYLSIRLKPTSDLLPVVKDLYTKLLSIERTIEAGPKQRPAAMLAAAEELNRQLATLRFASYDDFMLHALSVEIASRQKLMKSADAPINNAACTTTNAAFADLIFRQQDCREVDKELQAMFVGLDQFKAMSQQLSTHSRVVMRSADSIRTLSMNATISAGKLGQKGATLQVVAQSLGNVSLDSERLIDELTHDMTSVVSVLNQLVFDVAATKLQTEIILQFLDEIRNGADTELDPRLEESLRILFDQVAIRVEAVFDHLRETEQRILNLSAQLEKLNRNNRTLRFVQFAGQKESSICEEAVTFAVVFDNVRSHIDHTHAECETLGASILEVLQRIRSLQNQHEKISARLAGMRDLAIVEA